MTHGETLRNGRALTLPQRCIVVEGAVHLVQALAVELVELADGAWYTSGLAVHDLSCLALDSLGVFEPAGRRRTWRPVVPPDRVRAHVRALAHLSRSVFDETLQAFVEHACGHRRSLPDTRDPFRLPAEHTRMGAALLAAGYLDRAGEAVTWTPRITPVMQEALLWDTRGVCLSELYALQEEAEARLFLAGLPDALRAALRRTVLAQGPMAGLKLLGRHWTGAAWTELPSVEAHSLAAADLRISVYSAAVDLILSERV